jgi:hypothetical protein
MTPPDVNKMEDVTNNNATGDGERKEERKNLRTRTTRLADPGLNRSAQEKNNI